MPLAPRTVQNIPGRVNEKYFIDFMIGLWMVVVLMVLGP